jgi:superfamily II DNA or RNA helicase
VLQDESLVELAEAHRLKQAAGLIVLPPGCGKTRIAAEDAKRYKTNHLLYVAHTHEILDVAASEFEATHGSANVRRVTSVSALRKPAAVNLVTIQLLHQDIDSIPRSVFDYVVVDEFHHAAAPSYRRLLDRVRPRFLLGLTATPFRGDRQDILQLCGENILVQYELRNGIETGILSPYHYFGCFDDIDYSKIRHNGYRYDIRDLEKALVLPERNDAIVETWRKLADGKPTLAYCCSHKHANRFAEYLRSQGIQAEVYLSDTSIEERRRILELHSRGDVSILCTVDVLNEGADLPYVECLLFLRPTESKRIFYQQLGRGLRRYVGKSHCVVVDFIGNFKNAYKIVEYHGLVPIEESDASTALSKTRNSKDVLNLPLGCKVSFDTRVVDMLAIQVLDPRFATRTNIARILIFQYQRLANRLARKPSRRDIDHNCRLDASFYDLVFGSWSTFQKVAEDIEIKGALVL